MPGRLYLTHHAKELGAHLGAPCSLDLVPRRNIQPGQDVAVLTAKGWTWMRWGLIPVGRVNARGRPVMEVIVNARSETVFTKSAFRGLRRAVIPATGWYERTGEKRRKRAWDLSLSSGAPLVLAAVWDLWRAPGGAALAQVAGLTCQPNGDVAPIHHRMGVFLDPDVIPDWLNGGAGDRMAPMPDGLLTIREVTGAEGIAP